MIIRNKNRETFTVISNQAINDPQISDKALGTLVRLLSKPDNWNLNINYMAKTGKQGRTAIRSSIAELEKAGYIHKQPGRTKSGQITRTEYLVYEDAVAREQAFPNTSDVSSNVRKPKASDVARNPCQHILQDETLEQPHISQVTPPTRDEAHSQEARSQETHSQETAPVINNIEQRLRVTTTTTQNLDPESKPEVEMEKTPSSSYPAKEDINSLLDLIPEQHSQPMVISLVNKAAKEHTALEMEEAITYATANVRGGWMQYKAYLDKTLKNKWAAGYLETITTSAAVVSPGGFAGAMPAGKFPNGTVTGCARMDSNYMAAAQFMAEMGVEA